MSDKAIPELSEATRAIMDRLKATKEGDLISYNELSRIAGRSVLIARYLMDSARRRLLVDEQMLFEAVSGIGLKRMADAGKAAAGIHAVQKMRRVAKNGTRKIASIQNIDGLSPIEKANVLAASAVLGAVSTFSKNSVLSSIASETISTGKPVDMSQTLKLFGRASKKDDGEEQRESA